MYAAVHTKSYNCSSAFSNFHMNICGSKRERLLIEQYLMPGSWPLLHIFVVFQLLFHTIWDKRLKIETPVVLNGTGMLLIFWNITIVNRGLTMMAMVRKSVIIVINLMTLIILQLEVFLDACFRPSCPSLRLWKHRSQVFRSFGEIQLTMFEKYTKIRSDPGFCDKDEEQRRNCVLVVGWYWSRSEMHNNLPQLAFCWW